MDFPDFPTHVRRELQSTRHLHGPVTGFHDGYAKLLEEVDEFWDEVRKKENVRSQYDALKELVQVAAMAQRIAEDLLLIEKSKS